MAATERDYSELQPQELNEEFHKLMRFLPAIPISMMGTLMDWDQTTEMTEEEYGYFLGELDELRNQPGIFGRNSYADRTLSEIETGLDDSTREQFIAQAKGSAAMERRMTFGATLLVKLDALLPYVRGSESFRQYVPRAFKRMISEGSRDGGRDHWMYGDDNLGGIFHPEVVESIEEKSLQIFSDDIAWYGKDPMMIMGELFPADYDNDPFYRDLVDFGRKWKPDFIERYHRIPVNVRGQEIQIP